MEALAQHQLRMRDVQPLVQRRAGRALHAMVRPKHLGSVGAFDGVEGLAAGMRGREGGMPRRVPVLGDHHVDEAPCEKIDQRHHRIGVANLQAAAAREVLLHVHHEQAVLRADQHGRRILT